jgi:2-desacetyl-2-hydroxyethyl bacteriochlorophyllide A dehydrogenase
MRAAVLNAPGQLEIKSIPMPEPGYEELVVKVHACGVCGTDVNLYAGKYSANWPVVLGHEFAGEVVEVGPGTDLEIGARVTADPNESCGSCYWCHSGQPTHCQKMAAYGVLRDGAFAEYISVGIRGTYPIPPNLDYELATFAEPVSCALRGADRAGYRPGETAIIIGDGTMGLIHVQLAAQSGLSRLIVVGHHDEKLLLAKKLGATETINAKHADVHRQVLELTDGVGTDVVMEVVGKPPAVELALRLAKKGGRIVIFGFAPEGATATFSPFEVLSRELTILGGWVNPYTFPRAIDLLTSGKVDVRPFLTTHLSLEEARKGIELMMDKPQGFIKAMVRP